MSDTPPEQTVPYARFKEVNDQLKAAQARIGELEPAQARVEELTAQAAEHALALERAQSGASRQLSLARAGIIDDDDADYVLHRYGRLGDGAPDFGEWLKDGAEKREGWWSRVLPSAATPAPVSTPATPAPASTPPAPASTPAPMPSDRTGDVPAAVTHGAYSPEAIARMSPTQYRAAREHILNGSGR